MARGGATGASSTSHVVWSWPLARCRHSAEEPGAVPSAAGWIRVGLLSNHELGKGYSNGKSRLQQADDLRRTRHDPLQQLVRRRQSQASGPGAADRRWSLHARAIRRRGARLAGVGGFAPLSIFGFRDHGALLVIAGLRRRAVQYDIGNPLTASKMTRHQISAGLYAPIRVLLREDSDGGVAFEYDRPASVFGQFGDEEVDMVARQLDQD